jgi:hypothetical protein
MLASLVCGDPVYKRAAPSSNLHYFFMSGGFDPTPVTPISMNFVSYFAAAIASPQNPTSGYSACRRSGNVYLEFEEGFCRFELR